MVGIVSAAGSLVADVTVVAKCNEPLLAIVMNKRRKGVGKGRGSGNGMSEIEW